ncbi:c-type cytochrome [Hankyongella ginsenosidimutans]|uniref:C-type cytochrome n=1 Tax=Hankyongella ginsenosidimutans TaxID=1763828 RepID=A0A4D7CBR7_9SPHN|nr:c-type cytochrome [Hankyongella ginsenosidimutans]QCI80076.1 c-type cytochrome [Hankyongella ginsenosidimutans]
MLLSAVFYSVDAHAQDSQRGERLYEARCGGCHSLDKNRVGPMHRGVVGRKVATVAGYRYSKALAAKNFIWDEALLDAWLTAPAKLAPGTAMGFRVADATDRKDIIAYLAANSPAKPSASR